MGTYQYLFAKKEGKLYGSYKIIINVAKQYCALMLKWKFLVSCSAFFFEKCVLLGTVVFAYNTLAISLKNSETIDKIRLLGSEAGRQAGWRRISSSLL